MHAELALVSYACEAARSKIVEPSLERELYIRVSLNTVCRTPPSDPSRYIHMPHPGAFSNIQSVSGSFDETMHSQHFTQPVFLEGRATTEEIASRTAQVCCCLGIEPRRVCVGRVVGRV